MKKAKKTQIFLFFVVIVLGMTFSFSKYKTSAVNGNPVYMGAEYCGNCHVDIYEGWNQTNHANAVGFMQNGSGNFYSVGSSYNVPELPPANSSSWRSEASFVSICRNCHVTGGNDFDPLGVNQTWPEKDTDPTKFLNIQCEVCHGAYQSHGSTNPAMILNYSATLCELCHVPGSSHDNSYWQSAHAESLAGLLTSDHAADFCLSCMSTQGSLGLDVSLNTTNLESVSCVTCHDPHDHTYEAQLRYEDSTELCGTCHSQAEFFEDSAHLNAGLECTSCHGQGTHFAHGHESALVNHTWSVYGTYYPYNQTAAEEPVVCSTCHTQSWATTQLGVIQSLTTTLITNVTRAIDNAKASIDVANQTSGVNQTQIDDALTMVDVAEDYISDVERDSSEGFHNPEQTTAILGQAAHLASEAQSLAFEALASEATTLEAQVTSLENQTSTLQTDLENLQGRIDSLESTAATVPFLYAGLGLAIGFLVGAAILYALVGRKKP